MQSGIEATIQAISSATDNNGRVFVPSQRAELPRRIAASAVDLILVGFLWLLVLYRLAVRFEIAEREVDGTPVYSDNQRTALAEVAEGLNFGRIIGDFYYSIHGRGLILSMLSLLIFSLIAWVLIPANTGWSVGHRTFGLVVTDMRGNKPPLDSYLRRYLVGLVDLFPYVIPGLLGWIIASRNENHQRMGDLSADTIVIDTNTQAVAGLEVQTTVIRGGELSDPDPTHVDLDPIQPPAPANPGAMVNLEEALSGYVEPEPQVDDYPVLDLEPTTPTTGSVALSESMPPAVEGSGSDFVASLNEHEEVVAAAEAPLPETTYADDWHFPESQDAPVWTPEPSTTNGPAAASAGQTVTQSRTGAAAANEAAAPSNAGPSNEENADSQRAEAPTKASTAAASAAGMGDPVWNEEWKAWLFWDAEGSQWLRHDADKGWLPIGDSQKA